MQVSIFGTGYVGLVTALCLSKIGHNVTCIDIDDAKIKQLQAGIPTIHENGLAELLAEQLMANHIHFTTDSKAAINTADIIFIAVGTPESADGSANLTYVQNVSETIGDTISKFTIIVNKSTVPVGTGDRVTQWIQNALDRRQADSTFAVVSNPEFLKEGNAIQDCLNPDRIVVGSDNHDAITALQKLYKPLIKDPQQFINMDIRSAELTKHTANAFLAMKISFINEIAAIADNTGADINAIKAGIGDDPRISPKFLNPGCGFGGSCFPKDVAALKHTAVQAGVTPHLLQATLDRNLKQQQLLVSKVKRYFANDIQNKTIAIWGLAFKPNTDDIRNASSLTIIQELLASNVRIQAYDPLANDLVKQHFNQHPLFHTVDNKYNALKNADCLIIVTEWDEFRLADLQQIKTQLLQPVIFDGRNIYNPQTLDDYDIEYFGIGNNPKTTLRETIS